MTRNLIQDAACFAVTPGYGVEAVFRLLDGLADQFSAARK
jgi:hypothetical protein